MRFDDRYAEIATVAAGIAYQELDGSKVRADVPDSTTVMLGLAGANEHVTDNWQERSGTFPDLFGQIDGFAADIGISLPDDLATAIGDSLVVAVDGPGLDLGSISELEDMSSLRAGLKVATDPDAAKEIWEKVRAAAEDAGQPLDELPLEIVDDGYVIASDDEYASDLLDDDSLADSDVYTTAVKDADDADAVFFVNFEPIEDEVVSLLGEQGLGDDEIEWVRVLQAVGYSVHVRDNHAEMTLRISAE